MLAIELRKCRPQLRRVALHLRPRPRLRQQRRLLAAWEDPPPSTPGVQTTADPAARQDYLSSRASRHRKSSWHPPENTAPAPRHSFPHVQPTGEHATRALTAE